MNTQAKYGEYLFSITIPLEDGEGVKVALNQFQVYESYRMILNPSDEPFRAISDDSRHCLRAGTVDELLDRLISD